MRVFYLKKDHMAALLQEMVNTSEAESVLVVATKQKDAWRQFLTDVITAAGLLEHGKRDKGLASRIGKFAFDAMLASPSADVARDAELFRVPAQMKGQS